MADKKTEKHVKPSKEELQEKVEKAAKELDELEEKEEETPELDPVDDDTPEDDDTPTDDEEEDVADDSEDEEPEVDDEEDDDGEEDPEPTKPTVDYKEKFSESTREAQVLASKNRKLTETIEEAANLPEPTEEELKAEYPEWDDLTDVERRLIRSNHINTKRFDLVHGAVEEGKKIDEWAQKVDKYIEEKVVPGDSDLEGREDEFKSFAMKPTRRGVELDDLVGAFLYQVPSSNKKNKGSLFETGTGGPREKTKKSNKIGLEEARKIRENDYEKYKQLLKEGKIESEL